VAMVAALWLLNGPGAQAMQAATSALKVAAMQVSQAAAAKRAGSAGASPSQGASPTHNSEAEQRPPGERAEPPVATDDYRMRFVYG
jgi:hypothetical protein